MTVDTAIADECDERAHVIGAEIRQTGVSVGKTRINTVSGKERSVLQAILSLETQTDNVNTKFAFRPAVHDDFAQLLICDPYAQATPDRQMWLEAALEARQVKVIEHSEAVVGFAVIEHTFFGQAFVSLIAVAPAARRRGAALALLVELESACHSWKLFTSTNTSNIAAQKLFLRAGFLESGHIDNLDADDTELVYFKSVNSKPPHP